MATRTLTLPATCPKEPHGQESCAKCLHDQLDGTPGLRNISLHCADGTGQATVQLDYDPTVITLTQLDFEIKRAGMCLSSNRAQVILGIDGMVSPRVEHSIEAALAKLPGVVASASFASRSLRVEFDRTQCQLPEIVRRLDGLGLRLRENGPIAETPKTEPGWFDRFKIWLVEYHKLVMATAGLLLLIGAVVTKYTEGPLALRYGLVAGAFVVAGWYTAIDTFHVLLQMKFDIDVLMFAAAFGAAAIGKYEEGAFLLVLFAFGGAGEELAMDRARRAIEALAKLAPDTATVRDPNGTERVVRVETLQPGEKVVVRPFDRLPVDGVVESGTSSIDQSPITGESVPVDKEANDQVFAGTINGEGLLIVNVTKLASESTLAKIVKMVNEAQTSKSPTQLFTDKIERIYVPLVLVGTLVVFVLPPLLGFEHRQAGLNLWRGWFYQAMSFLTAASPCALAIGTPAAVLSGIAKAARIGVLVKGGAHLENLGKVNVIAFDKTGTLTRGRPAVTDIIPLNDMSENELLALSAAIEKSSTHPLAVAIVGAARSHGVKIEEATEVQQIAGKGMHGMVTGRLVQVGRVEMFEGFAHPGLQKLIDQGKSIVVTAVDQKPVGLFGLADELRPNARETLLKLKRLGIAKTIMLTGDRKAVAEGVAHDVGVDEFHADLLPHDKLDLVGKLQQQYGTLAMVGDGVNDAPALAKASVGIAMGGAGTDVAIETADIALMADDLGKLPEAIALSRFSRRIIKQNLTIALGVIAVLAPSAALGFTPLAIAVLFHEGSTVVVVLNSLRLLVWKLPPVIGD